jgi:DNA-binding LacI/PurR family transcriptional regulator
MKTLRLKSAAEQVAEHLRDAILRGDWSGGMPGKLTLSHELGVNHKTVEAALQMLETEGLLVAGGAGRRRRIELPAQYDPPALRIRIMLYGPEDLKNHYMLALRHGLIEAGHAADFASSTLQELKMDLKRFVGLVNRTAADAWVVLAASRDILEWCARQAKPFFALAGRMQDLPLAGTMPDKVPALRTAVRHLVALGHRRIVMLTREERRIPNPGRFERAFLEELHAHGIPTGAYNLPHWQADAGDFHRCLDALFRQTPPTALFIDEVPLFLAAQLHLAQRGILSPRDVSLICDDPDPAFDWLRPSVAYIAWDSAVWAHRIVRWAGNIARGKDDRRQSFTTASFMEGGTIGPVPAGPAVR